MDSSFVKQEKIDFLDPEKTKTINSINPPPPPPIIISSSNTTSSSSSDSDIDDSFSANLLHTELNRKRDLNQSGNGFLFAKKTKIEGSGSAGNVAVPSGFLSAIPPNFVASPMPLNFIPPDNVTRAVPLSQSFVVNPGNSQTAPIPQSCKQFWKAGDYEGDNAVSSSSSFGGMDHVRVHPKFLHSNATSHKWALGAFAELLDNALDEIVYGCTYVHVDVLKNRKDQSNMLVVEDDGGGMTPDKMRMCMSLGYSAKSKMANTIGQYGNGFKTSTMRLGADVIVFSRCQGKDGKSPTQSIGMLSYTFLRGTGKEDIVVPMIDYDISGGSLKKMVRSTQDDWSKNLETIVQWSPYQSEEALLQQFNLMKAQGTRIIIYNLWEDDEGNLELDFDSDKQDIQIRGVNRDDKNIEMAEKYPNSRHFLTYRHSLRNYASILYLRLPNGFRIILRGKDIEHHNTVRDMMLIKEMTYKPKLPEGAPNMIATVTLGFVKDARHHIDVQGFCVYHKNRLIKPFWRVWNAAGSDGRGVIGVLEANFIEPAHDKQGFERTQVLSRLEARLVKIQKSYWSTNCQEIGYAARRHSKNPVSPMTESRTPDQVKPSLASNQNRHGSPSSKTKSSREYHTSSPADDASEYENCQEASPADGECQQEPWLPGKIPQKSRHSRSKAADSNDTESLSKEEIPESRERLNKNRQSTKDDLQFERDRCKSLENQLLDTQNELKEAQRKIEELDQEQIALIDMIQEERGRRDAEEEKLRTQLREAAVTIEELAQKVRRLEVRATPICKTEH